MLPPQEPILPTTVRSLSPAFIALSTVLALFLLLTICLFLRLILSHSRLHTPPPAAPPLPRDPAQDPTVSRLALADLLGVAGSGSSLSDIDSAAPTFHVGAGAEHADDVCAVCLDALRDGQRARRLPCAHVYHDSCAVVWLVKADRCPVCAQPVVHKRRSEHDAAGDAAERVDEVSRWGRLTTLFRVRR